MEDNRFIVQRQERIARVTVNRPDKRNAFNVPMWLELQKVIAKLGDESDIRVIIITGAGEKSFVAGADISEMTGDYPPIIDGKRRSPVPQVTKTITEVDKVVIGMINGFAIGGGCQLAAACDLRVAADTARLGITSAKIGVCIEEYNIKALVDLVGPSRAKDILFTGRLLSADEAFSIGLVDYVVPKDELESFTMGLAEKISRNAPLSIIGSKHIVNRIVRGETGPKPEDGPDYPERCYNSEDFKEGVRAFLESRKPQFLGR